MNKEIEYYEFTYKIPKYKIKPPLDFSKYYEIHKDEIIIDLQQENQELKKQLEYLRSGEYYNQLRFERDMLQYVADNGKVSKEDKEFIDMTHRNTELLEVIEEVREYINSKVISNGEIIDQLRKIEVKELLQILDKAKEN